MRKLLLTMLFTIAAIAFVYSQDIIMTNIGDEIHSIVQEVTPDLIKYKKYDNPEGPVYSILKKDVNKIIYENGTEDVFHKLGSTFEEIESPQATNQELSYQTGFWGLTILQGNRKLDSREVRQVYSGDPEALSSFNSGKAMNAIGSIIGIPSAVVFGWQLGSLIAGGETNTTALAIGGAGFVAGIVLGISGESNIKRSVNLYNSHLKESATLNFEIGLSEYGIGLYFKF